MNLKEKIAAMIAELNRYCAIPQPTWEQLQQHAAIMRSISES